MHLWVSWPLADLGCHCVGQLGQLSSAPCASYPPPGTTRLPWAYLSHDSGRSTKEQTLMAFQVITCVMSANISLAKASHMIEFNDKYYSKPPHSQWKSIIKLSGKRCGYKRG